MQLDEVKWNDSVARGEDACGTYSYCPKCDKSLEFPCAKASALAAAEAAPVKKAAAKKETAPKAAKAEKAPAAKKVPAKKK